MSEECLRKKGRSREISSAISVMGWGKVYVEDGLFPMHQPCYYII